MKNLTSICLTLVGLFISLTLGAQTIGGQIDSQETTTIQFEEDTYDFGRGPAGRQGFHAFSFRNTGQVPLVITSVKGNCGCIAPQYSHQPILPGEVSEIRIHYDSKGKLGPKSYRITITANTDPPQTNLTVLSNYYDDLPIEEADTTHEEEQFIDPPEEARIQFEEDTFDFGTQQTGKVISHVYRFKNTGNTPLLISNARGSCGCTIPYYPKEPVLPGQESEIEVAFDSKGKHGPQSKRITIIANTVPPQTFLTIRGSVYDGPFPNDPKPDLQETTTHDLALQKIEEMHPNCFALFPNPTNDHLQLELKEHIGQQAEVMILNDQGQPVHQSRIEHISRDATRFDVSSYPPGIYMVTIRIQGVAPMTQCFVIAR